MVSSYTIVEPMFRCLKKLLPLTSKMKFIKTSPQCTTEVESGKTQQQRTDLLRLQKFPHEPGWWKSSSFRLFHRLWI